MTPPPLWPAHLHHVCLQTGHVDAIIAWYARNMAMTAERFDDGTVWLSGRQRNLVFRPTQDHGLGFLAYAAADAGQLKRFAESMSAQEVMPSDLRSPLFDDDQVAITDPDGNTFILGLPIRDGGRDADGASGSGVLPGRLQHMGLCSPDLDRLSDFYVNTVGFKLSDIVKKEDGNTAALFLRSDPEHHNLALFAASSSRFDHICHETTCWNDIRDWGDHFADQRTEIVWGAGRHGAGNNLFIFVQDPDGNMVELSAELETRTFEAAPDIWKAEPRTLNLWGKAWTRT